MTRFDRVDALRSTIFVSFHSGLVRVSGARGFSCTPKRWEKLTPGNLDGEPIPLPDIVVENLTVERTFNPKTPLPSHQLVFGKTFTDHMLSVSWSASTGWAAPKIHPYRPLVLDPSSTIFHYAPTLFEGLKAYRDDNDRVTLFRPDMNMKRMNMSAARAALPTFNGEALMTLLKKLVALDAHWIPKEPNHSLYIRPVLIGTAPFLGVAASSSALLYVIMSPVGPYYKNGFKPVSLLASTEFVRAFPGGTGGYKLGANYAGGLVPQSLAAKEGYDQVLWLHNKGGEDYVTEVGAMNLFVVLRRKDGITELATPPLDDMILPGITRDSILSLAHDHVSGKLNITGLPKDLKVSERHVTMSEIGNAAQEGRLLEVFGAGTAAIVCPVECIGYNGGKIRIPIDESGLGPITKVMLGEITGRQIGTIPSEWSVEVPPLV